MTDEWYRSPDWDAAAREEFEKRLARARPDNRAQYLRIKGLALDEAGETAGARSLWARVVEEAEGSAEIQRPAALEHLADSLAADDPGAALELYDRSLEGVRRGWGTSCMQHVKMAELLLDEPTASRLKRASDLLARWPEETQLPFPNAHFRWNLAVIRLAEARGDEEAARDAARRALDLADRGPVFSRHRDVGVVDADRRTMRRLARLAR